MSGCEDCGVEYGSPEWIEAVVPDRFWYEISPTGDEGGLLCFQCMRKRFETLGYGQNGKHAVPFKIYYPGGSMASELYENDKPENYKYSEAWSRSWVESVTEFIPGKVRTYSGLSEESAGAESPDPCTCIKPGWGTGSPISCPVHGESI